MINCLPLYCCIWLEIYHLTIGGGSITVNFCSEQASAPSKSCLGVRFLFSFFKKHSNPIPIGRMKLNIPWWWIPPNETRQFYLRERIITSKKEKTKVYAKKQVAHLWRKLNRKNVQPVGGRIGMNAMAAGDSDIGANVQLVIDQNSPNMNQAGPIGGNLSSELALSASQAGEIYNHPFWPQIIQSRWKFYLKAKLGK